MDSQYVIWNGNDGPSLHGPFESEAAAIKWAWDEGIALDLIDTEEWNTSLEWYLNTPDVWVRPVLVP